MGIDGGGREEPVLCGVSRAAASEPAMIALVILLRPRLTFEWFCDRNVPRVGEIGALANDGAVDPALGGNDGGERRSAD